MSEIFTISKAKADDLIDIFDLANDPAVRESSFNQEKILLENHREWFLGSINNPKCFFYILREKKNSEFIGSLRFNEIENNSFLIGIQIAEKYRGSGIGQRAIINCIKVLATENPKLSSIVAHVKKTNIASQKVFLKIGFNHIGSNCKNGSEYDIFEKSL